MTDEKPRHNKEMKKCLKPSCNHTYINK